MKENSNKDGVDRRGFLGCMAWAGTGMIWTVSGGVLGSKAFGQMPNEHIGGGAGFSFVQISDSHIGFNKAANNDVTATLQQALNKINGLERTPDFLRLWCKSQSALAFVADSVRERPVSRAFWQKQISTLLFQLNDLHQNHCHATDGMRTGTSSAQDESYLLQG